MDNATLRRLAEANKPGVWYVRRISTKAGGNDKQYWIVTCPSEFFAAIQRQEIPNRDELGRTFPRDKWRAALDWAIQKSRGRVVPPVVRGSVDTAAAIRGVAIPQGPSRHFVAGNDLDVVYPESSDGELRINE